MDEFNSDYHCIYYCGQQSLRRNGVDFTFNKGVQNAYFTNVHNSEVFKENLHFNQAKNS